MGTQNWICVRDAYLRHVVCEIANEQDANKIRRHRSTICCVNKSNHFTDSKHLFLRGYFGIAAQKLALKCRIRRWELVGLCALGNPVIE